MATNRIRGPGWPDLRGWAILGFFFLTFYSLWMIRENPALLANASFMQFISQLATGGLLLVGSYLFGGTKASGEGSAKTADALNRLTPGSTPPA